MPATVAVLAFAPFGQHVNDAIFDISLKFAVAGNELRIQGILKGEVSLYR
jgi:hypothetical protein